MSAYWVVCYREIRDQQKLADYAALAGPAIQDAGGRYLARGTPAAAYEAGQAERTVLVEFDDLDAALAAHDTPAYREALDALGDGAVRDVRVVAGADG